ncbi:MAG: CDP-alcohol phosphatidyltransferase family protein [Anaerolineaceae bacterium]|nr:CDP-alcohol phosphatidyltransferase family protein [Anaerolineaceae bacterium]
MNKKNNLEKIEKHHRVNDILLGPLERPAIAWLVKHLPTWVTPDHLTFLGFLAAILIAISYWLTNFDARYLWLANLGFILSWFGDSLDGNLARYRKIERPKYGFFIDHTVDTISEVSIFFGMGLSPYVDFNLALIALAGYLCMANLVYITTSVKGEFKISYGSLGPTEARVIAMIANTIVFFIGNPMINLPIGQFSLYKMIIIVVICLLFFFFFYTTITQAIELERIDRKKLLEKFQNADEKRN